MNTKQAWLDKRKQDGICLQCGGKAGPKSKLYCASCASKFSEHAKARASRLVTQGLCIQCMGSSASRVCPSCREKNTQARRGKVLERERSGICVKCGKEPCVKSNRRCATCCLKHSAWTYFKSTNRWADFQSLFNSQHGVCPYSGRSLTIGFDAEIDHIIPRSAGGTDELSNLQWVHSDVNKMKAHQLPEQFLSLVAEIYLHQGKRLMKSTQAL